MHMRACTCRELQTVHRANQTVHTCTTVDHHVCTTLSRVTESVRVPRALSLIDQSASVARTDANILPSTSNGAP